MNLALPLLADAWRFFKRHLWAICWLILPVVVPFELFKLWAGLRAQTGDIGEVNVWLGLVIGLLIAPLYQGAFIIYVAAQLRGGAKTLSQCLNEGLAFWLPLALLYLVTGVLSIVGFLFLILPGFYFMSRFAFADLYCVLHAMGPKQAIIKSWRDTQVDMFTLFVGLLIIYAAVFLVSFGVGSFLERVELAAPLTVVINGGIEAVASSLFTIFSFRVFAQSTKRFDPAVNS